MNYCNIRYNIIKNGFDRGFKDLEDYKMIFSKGYKERFCGRNGIYIECGRIWDIEIVKLEKKIFYVEGK